jgi:hypothetical protein
VVNVPSPQGAAVVPADSGGPVYNEFGEIIGAVSTSSEKFDYSKNPFTFSYDKGGPAFIERALKAFIPGYGEEPTFVNNDKETDPDAGPPRIAQNVEPVPVPEIRIPIPVPVPQPENRRGFEVEIRHESPVPVPTPVPRRAPKPEPLPESPAPKPKEIPDNGTRYLVNGTWQKYLPLTGEIAINNIPVETGAVGYKLEGPKGVTWVFSDGEEKPAK